MICDGIASWVRGLYTMFYSQRHGHRYWDFGIGICILGSFFTLQLYIMSPPFQLASIGIYNRICL